MERMTNYYTAAHWLHNSLILCNDIGEIDYPSMTISALTLKTKKETSRKFINGS
ncbi:MAG: hypothetical protein IKI40_10900 [Treponema sp.]|nr:hypothetical protein [Treponema sp.]